MLFRGSVIIVALVATCAFAVPTGHRSSCSVECTANDKYFYETGKTYEYEYFAETRTGISEITDDDTEPGIRVVATVHIYPISPCEYQLTLSKVSTDSPSSSEKFATEVTKNAIQFNMQNGEVVSVCPSTDEPKWVLNFKKGILSTFQNTMTAGLSSEVVTETDISGVCKTVYESHKEGDEVVIKKTKVPTECTKKPQTSSQMASFGFNMDPIVEGMTPITSEQTCTYNIHNKIVKSATCNEMHTFKPFSQQEAGKVHTWTATTLYFLRNFPSALDYEATFDFKTGLDFEHTEMEEMENLILAEELLSKLETATHDGIQKEVPQLFSELVSYMKKLTKSQIRELVNVADDKHTIKFVYDAMPLVGTPDSNEYVTDLIREGKYSEHDIAVYYASLAFIRNPSEDMFNPLLELLENEETLHHKAMLGISSLVHNYCEKHEDCTSVEVIDQIIRHFESYLGTSCRSTDEENKSTVLVALKSLGNIGRWINGNTILHRCFIENNPTEIRIAAIEAWRRSPCSYNRNHLLSTYEDSSYDSEVRIAAYLQVMKCPTQTIVDTIKDRLTSEGVNHVSSFVWSHLNNIQESAAQDKQWIRELIGEEFLKEKYTNEMMKFSRYFESSLYSKELNVGGSVDADVIFSKESFIPRSAMLNLTVNLFGQPINLFEVGGRIEGYEHFIEKFFGPNGYYPDETIEQVIKNLRDDKFEKSPELAKLIGHSSTDPKGSMFVRFLGNELFYTSHIGTEDILSQLGFKSPMDLIVEMFTKGNVNFMKSFNLVKSKFTVPTITGFPLQVSFDGSATVGFVLDGDFNAESFDSFELQGKLKPSAAVTIDSSMTVDAFVTTAGRKFTTTLHSSSIAEGKAVVKGLKLVDFSLHIPNEDMTVYEYSHDVIRVENGEEHKEFVESDMETSCYPNGGALGIQLCNHVQTTKHGELLTRNLIVKKMDTHTSYDFHFIRDDDTLSVLFDMPNSKESNRHKLSYHFDGKNYEAEFHCPHMYKTVNGVFDLSGKDKMLTFHLLDGPRKEEMYAAEFSLENTHTRTAYIIKPSVKYSVRGHKVTHIDGVITNDFARNVFEVEATSSSTTGPFPLVVPSGKLEFAWKYGEKSQDVALKLSSYHKMGRRVQNVLNVELIGSTEVTNDHIDLMLDGNYQYYGYERTTLNVISSIQKESSPDGAVYKVFADIPHCNIKTTNVLSLLKSHYGMMSDVNVGDSHWKFDTYYKSLDNNDEKFVAGKIWLETYHMDTRYGVEKTFSKDKHHLETIANAAWGNSDASFKSHLMYEYGRKLHYKLSLPKHKLEMDLTNSGNGGTSFEGFVKSVFMTGDLKGVLYNHSKKNMLDLKLDATVSHVPASSGYEKTYSIKSYLDTDSTEFNLDFQLAKLAGSSAYKLYVFDDHNLIHLTAKATPSSIYFSSNMFQPFKIDVKFLKQEESNRVEAIAHYGEQAVEIMGDYSPNKIIGLFKSQDKTINFSGHLTGNGLETFIMWAPDKQIDVMVKYDNTEKTSIFVDVQTPFHMWRKQELTISYLLNNHHLESSVNLIWRNTQHVNFSTNLHWNIESLWTNEVSGKMHFTSTIPEFERIQFSVDHTADIRYKTMKTHVHAKLPWSEVTAQLDANLSNEREKVEFKFDTPYTAYSIRPLHMEYLGTTTPEGGMEKSLSYVSGSQKSLFQIKCDGYMATPRKYTLKVNSPYLPLIDLAINYEFENRNPVSTSTLLIDNKNVFSVTITDKSKQQNMNVMNTAYEITGKLIHPITGVPLSVNSVLLVDNGILEFDFDMTPIKDRKTDRVKFHAKTNLFIMTPYDIYISGHFSGYGTKASASLIHKIDMSSYEIGSKLLIDFNSFNLDMSVEALVDPRQYTGSMTATMKSSVEDINGVVFTAKHEVEGNARNTFIRYKKGYTNSKMYSSIKYSDALNWSNVFVVDDVLTITNKMSSPKNNHFLHELEWNIFGHELFSIFEKSNGVDFKTKLSLSMPNASPIQIHVSHEFASGRGVFSGKAIYGEGEKITTQTEYVLIGDYVHLKHETLSKYYSWTPFEVEFEMNAKVDKEIKISAASGSKFGILISLYDKRDAYGAKLSFVDKETNKQILIHGEHQYSGKEKYINIEGKFNEEPYSANIAYSRDQTEIDIHTELNVPYLSSEPIKTSVIYNFHKGSFTAEMTNGVEVYDIQGKLEDNSLIAEITKPNGKLNLVGKWLLTDEKGDIQLHLQCNECDTKIGFEYNNGYHKEGVFYVVHNGMQYKANGAVHENSVSFQFRTPENMYKMISTLNVSHETELETILTRNSEEIRIKGKGNFDNEQGSLSVSIMTPFNNGEEDFVSVLYRLDEVKELKLEGKFAENHILGRFLQQPKSSSGNSEMMLEIKLPIQNYEEISIVNKNEHNIRSKISELTVHILGKEVCSARYLLNNRNIEFGITHADAIIDGKIQFDAGMSFILNFDNNVSQKSIAFNYGTVDGVFNAVIKNNDFSAEVTGSAKMLASTSDFSFLLKTFKSGQKVSFYEGQFSFDNSDKFILETVINNNGREYFCKYRSSIHPQFGQIKINVKTPFRAIDTFSADGMYNLLDSDKLVEFTSHFNGVKQVVSAHLQVTDNKFMLMLDTPIKMFNTFKVEGYYDDNEGFYRIRGEFNEDESLTIEGKVTPATSGYLIQATVPTSAGRSQFIGEIARNTISFAITDPSETRHFITANYELNHSKQHLSIETSYPEFKKFAISSNFPSPDNEYSLTFKMQNYELDVNTEIKAKLNPGDCQLKLFMETGSSEYYAFKLGLNTRSALKTLVITIDSEDFHHFFDGKVHFENNYYDHFVGIINAKSSIKELKHFNFEINFEQEENELYSKWKFDYNDISYNLSFHTRKTTDMYHISSVVGQNVGSAYLLSFDLHIDTRLNNAQATMTIGEKMFKIETQFTSELKKQLIQVTVNTPYKEYEHLFLNVFYDLTEYKSTVQVDIHHNTPVIEFKAVLSTDIKKPEIHLKVNSRYTDHMEVRASLNTEDTTDLIGATFKLSDSLDYAFGFGYTFNYQRLGLSLKLKCPHQVFGEIYDFAFNTDFTFDEKKNSLALYFEKDREVLIDIKGAYFDEKTSIDLHLPNDLLGNFHTHGLYDRSKRSIEMQMMNDHHTGGLVARFHSLKINLQTPFQRIKKMSFSLTKDNNGKWVLNYKRNENYLNFEAGRTSKGIEAMIDLALPSWELLAMTGRLTEEELEGYLTGRLPETQLTLTGKGVYGRKKGLVKYEMNAPGFPTLKKANAKFEYNVRKGTYTFSAKSSTNKDFKIFLEFKRGGLFIDVFVPHKDTPTIAKGQLTIFKGKLDISSRFPAIRSYHLEYSVEIRKTVDIKFKIQRNGVEVFNLEFHRGADKNHFLVERRREGVYSKFHYHRMGWDHLEIIAHRNGKELSANLKGSGNLPLKGEITFVIKNSFRYTPREVTGSLKIDRTGSPKQMILRVERSPSDVFTVTANYNIDLKNLRKGDLNIKVDTKKKIAKPWKNINLEWEFDTNKNGYIKLNCGDKEVKLTGKLSLKESDFIISTNKPGVEDRVYGWKYERRGSYRDYMVKFGPAKGYTLLELSGTINDLRNADIKGKIKSRFAPHALSYTAKWAGNKNIGISGDGTFEMGNKKGAFKLHHLKRDPIKRASNFKLTGTSNIKGFSKYSIIGEYDVSARLIDIKFKWDTDELSLYTKIDNFTAKKSQNTATFNIPRVGPSQINFGHDFTNPLDKRVRLDGHFGGKDFHYNERWTRNAEFTVFNLEVDIKSNFVGIIKMTADYDIRDIDNASGHIVYTRDGKNNVNVDWHRTKTDNSIVNEVVIDSKSRLIPSSKAYFKANWEPDKFLASSIGLEWKNKKIEAVLNVDKKMAKFYTKTPFPNVDDITAVLKYDLQKKIKTVTLNYERGQRKVNFSFVINYKSKNKGSLDISLTTPFTIIKKVMFNAKWNKGKFDAHYQRNDKKIDIAGKADIKQGKSSYDFVFTPKSGNQIHIKLNYDVVDFFRKTSKKEQQIFHLEVDGGKHKVNLNVNGYSSKEKLILHTEGTSSLPALKTFRVRLDSELNLENREGLLDIKINDFEYRMKNKFQKLENGFYFRTQIHSTLTRLPGLTLGYGKDGTARTVTLGYGDEREISISLNGKDKFKKGLYGKIDIPRKGIMGIEYDIDYDFIGEDKFNVKAELRLKNGKKINYEFNYHSDGVKARLAAPIANIRRLRAKRSANDAHNMEEYAITIQSGRGDHVINKGILIEGQIFGKPFSVDTYLNLKEATNAQGKLIIHTPFVNYEKLGGHFTIKQHGKKVSGHGEAFFHGHASAEFEADMNDVSGKNNVIGTFAYTPVDEGTTSSINFVTKVTNDQSTIHIKSSHQSLIGDHSVTVKMNTRKDGQYISVTYDGYKFDVDYEFRASPTYFRIFSEIQSGNTVVHRGEVLTSFDNDEFSLTTDISVKQNSHHLKAEINSSEDLAFEITYENMNEVSFTAAYRNSDDRKQLTVEYDRTKVLHFDMYKGENSCHLIFEVNSVHLPKLHISSDMGETIKAKVEVSSSFGIFETELEFRAHQEFLFKTNTKFTGDSTYIFKVQLLKNEHGYEFLGKLVHGAYEHLLNGNFFIMNKAIKMYFIVGSPIFASHHPFVDLRASWQTSLKISFKTSWHNSSHSIEIEADNEPKFIRFNIWSPNVPTEHCAMELHIEGESIGTSKIKILLSTREHSYFGNIITNLDSTQEKQIEVLLRTPVMNFEEIRFGGGYKTGSMKEAFIYAQPFNYKAEFFVGKELNKYKVGFEVVPGKNELPTVAAEALIPLDKISPHLFARYGETQYDLDFVFNNTDYETEVEAIFSHNGQKNGGKLHYTKQFPVELEYEVLQKSESTVKFHIMVDSSIFTITNGVYLLL